VREPDGFAYEAIFCPPVTLPEVLAGSPPGTVAEPLPEPQGEPAPELAQAVNDYLDRIGETYPPTRAEARALAASRPDIAARYLSGDLAAPEAPDPGAITEAVDERAAILEHLGAIPREQAERIAGLAEGYNRHHWICPACRSGTLAGAQMHRLCPEGARRWHASAEAADEPARSTLNGLPGPALSTAQPLA
jgi:hypothetical protein